MTPRNSAYLAFVRDHVSCLWWDGAPVHRDTTEEAEETIAAHVRFRGKGGMGLKPSDYRTVPLTDREHREQHQKGERSFWRGIGVNPDKIIIALLTRWVGDDALPVVEKFDGDDEALISELEAMAERRRRKRGA